MTDTGNGNMSSDPSAPAVPAPDRSGVAETFFAALSAALLFALFLLLPLAGLAALAFAGVPLVRLTHRRGLAPGLAGAALAVGLLTGIGLAAGGDAATGALLAAVWIGLPVLFAGAVRAGKSPSGVFLLLAAAGFALLAGALFTWESRGSRPIKQDIAAAFDAMTPSPGAAEAKGVEPEAAARLATTMRRLKEFAQTYWPGLIGASWVLGAAVSFFAGAVGARPVPSAVRTRFEDLRVPAPVVAFFVASGAVFALLPAPARTAAGDLLLPLSTLYFLTGLSIICHFARKWFRARILRAGLYALVVYFPLNVGVGLLGLFDWYADFRRKGEKA
jgi:hypothetical protein